MAEQLTDAYILKACEEHCIGVMVDMDGLKIMNEYVRDGILFKEWVKPPRTKAALMAWLGY